MLNLSDLAEREQMFSIFISQLLRSTYYLIVFDGRFATKVHLSVVLVLDQTAYHFVLFA